MYSSTFADIFEWSGSLWCLQMQKDLFELGIDCSQTVEAIDF